MRNRIPHLFLCFIALACSTIIFGQEKEKTPTTKDVTEKSAEADHIHANDIRKKQLNSSPVQLTKPDTAKASSKKPAISRKKKTKKQN